MLKPVVLLSRISGIEAVLRSPRDIASSPSEASEGNKNSQPINNTKRAQEVMLNLTEYSNLGRILDQIV
tara:strand:+ start:2097 stop:2303 length:207 start_codon:yes stop_codon:yes gene_type:complete